MQLLDKLQAASNFQILQSVCQNDVLDMAINYQRLVEDSVRRLSDLMRQRRRLDTDIARLQSWCGQPPGFLHS